uniref:hypothetical protein n=1 Tax=Rhodococcus qingshengii TaxID=334542 RepID=UPI001C4E26E2|nr:hypothetical protein [Rhodococcus qingshengii]
MSEPLSLPDYVELTKPPRDSLHARALEASRVAHMVNCLPQFIEDPALPIVVRQACVETFFTHVRSLIEFLEIREAKQPNKDDFFAKSIVPDWKPVIDNDLRTKLNKCWKEASKHVAHLSKKRATTWTDVTEASLQLIADDVLTVWDQYAEAAAPNLFARRRSDLHPFWASEYPTTGTT